MEYIVTGEQSRLIDSYSINRTGIPSLVLMERASLLLADEVCKYINSILPENAGGKSRKRRKLRIISLCGSGNNGGDGMAAARILYTRGYDASILLAGKREKLSPDAARQLEIADNIGVSIRSAADIKAENLSSMALKKENFSKAVFKEDLLSEEEIREKEDQEEVELFTDLLSSYDIIIDALFGTGLSRDIGGSYRNWVRAVNEVSENGAYVFAVDIASGVNSENGAILGTAVKADETVTFGYRKLGMVLYPGAAFSGKIVCDDIGFDKNALKQFESLHFAFDESDLALLPQRKADSNKGTYGKALIIAGSRNMAGAAALSGKAAYKMGAGLVTLYTPECNRLILQELLPEAVMKTYDEENVDLEELISLAGSHTVIVLGPGLGKSPASEKIVETVLSCARVPLIVDADALNILSEHRQWLKNAQTEIAITPHIKELSRLTGYNTQTLKNNLHKICVDFSSEYGVICIAKDSRTMIFGQMQNIYINLSGNNGMSTGGSGDVLTGIIAGICAQSLNKGQSHVQKADFMQNCALGVYIHGFAGDMAAKEIGTYSMTAGDIVDAIPEVIRKLS